MFYSQTHVVAECFPYIGIQMHLSWSKKACQFRYGLVRIKYFDERKRYVCKVKGI